MRKIHFLCIMFFLTFTLCPSGAEQTDPPGAIRLLPNYQHQARQSYDTEVGRIWKEDGLLIHYDIGPLAGNFATVSRPDQRLWYKEQASGRRRVQLALTKDRTLYVTFPDDDANFYATLKTEEDLVDMLLMVLTYSPAKRSI